MNLLELLIKKRKTHNTTQFVAQPVLVQDIYVYIYKDIIYTCIHLSPVSVGQTPKPVPRINADIPGILLTFKSI